MAIIIDNYWNTNPHVIRSDIRRVMTWRGFVDNAESIMFRDLNAGKTFAYYLNKGYGETRQRRNGIQWSYGCKYVNGCPFCIILLAASRNISDGHTSVDNQEFVVTRCIGHNHDTEGNSIPIYGRRRLKGGKWVTVGGDLQIPANNPIEDDELDYTHHNDERLLKSEEWYNKSLGELSTHVSNLRNEWKAALQQRDVILDACHNPPRHHVDVVTEITMEDGMMVMNGSKPTDHSEDMLS